MTSKVSPSGRRMRERLMHPNSLTLFRILASPAVVLLMLAPVRLSAFMAAMVFSAAAITDYLDGYLARSRGLVTTFGKVMDPMADKLLVSTAFIMLTAQGWTPAWIVCVIVAREIAVTALRGIMAEHGKDVSASGLGKYKTGFQIAAIIPLLMHYTYFGIDMQAIGAFFLWGALIFTVWSGVDYFIRFRKLLEV
ncbi:MAG TPA: CDP-diacylglycerol--glycerol-3-phosphate 3-phosphatidyltransferase [Desulfobacterales bacterium]|nr:CDP-diacylglycerol--glycerol-3-phosphate 3-phosphatidyltransferase [Desulfobacterales bacterium]